MNPTFLEGFAYQADSVDGIWLGLDRQIQAKSGDLAIPYERSWIC
jgi:hypothetical protein